MRGTTFIFHLKFLTRITRPILHITQAVQGPFSLINLISLAPTDYSLYKFILTNFPINTFTTIL